MGADDKRFRPSGHGESFEATKRRIVGALNFAFAMPVHALSAALSQGPGTLNWRTAACHIPGHTHPSLARFLGCCGDVVELRHRRNTYVLLADRERLARGRRDAFCLPRHSRAFWAGLEALLCTMLPSRAPVPLADFHALLQDVYGTGFEGLSGGVTLVDFLARTGTTNVRISAGPGGASISATPLGSPEYARWDGEAHALVERREQEVLVGAGLGLAQTGPGHRRVFGDCAGGDLARLLQLADLNLPKMVQGVAAGEIPRELAYTPVWQYLRHSVNFDGERTFFQ